MMSKKYLVGLALLLVVSGCGDKSNQAAPPNAADAVKPAEPAKQPDSAAPAPGQAQAESKEAILAKHMKCREEKGADCFKMLDQIKGEAAPSQEQQQAEKKAHNDAVMAKHMKCRQEQGADCFKILEEMQK